MSSEIRRQKPRGVDQPKPGFFLMRLVKHGPLVPAAIHYAFGVWWAEINGEALPSHEDPVRAEKVCSIWHCAGEEIDRAEYLRRLGRQADESDPSSRPTEAIDLANLAPLF